MVDANYVYCLILISQLLVFGMVNVDKVVTVSWVVNQRQVAKQRGQLVHYKTTFGLLAQAPKRNGVWGEILL